MSVWCFRVQSLGFRFEGFRVRGSGLGARTSARRSLEIRPPGRCSTCQFGFRVSGFGFRILGSGFRVSGSGFRVPGFGFQISGSRFRVSGFGSRFSGFGSRVQGSRFRALGFGFRVSDSGFCGLGLTKLQGGKVVRFITWMQLARI